MAIISIYVTHSSEAAAQQIVKQLLQERLIACGNCFPMKSMYSWKGQIEKEDEWVSLLKSIPENWNKCQERITELHPYEVPCILKYDIQANEGYEDWVREECA